MKKFFEIFLAIALWVSFILMVGAAEVNSWGWVFLFLGIMGIIVLILNKFYSEEELEEFEKDEIPFRETIPTNFIENLMKEILNTSNGSCNDISGFRQDDFEVVRVYFAGRTLCIDVKSIDNKFTNIITISSAGTCGWFNFEYNNKGKKIVRDTLSPIEKDMYVEICKRNNINIG